MKTVLLGFALFLLIPFNAYAETSSIELRISANGNASQQSSLPVGPREVIDLKADTWGMGGECTSPNGCQKNRVASDFQWSSDDRPNATCDLFNSSECSAETDFRVTGTGVQFMVPDEMTQPITITARERGGDLAASLTLTLRTPIVEEAPPTPAPQVVVLQHEGHWVSIEGVSYWVPNTYRPDWVPYQHGHWVFVPVQGWTWVSYDPWGAYTDHYGIWRLHASYGWIWLPFEHPVYHPSTVTFFFSNGHIGWSPYYSGYASAYRWGERQGFRDGFHVGMSASTVSAGLTVVPTQRFYASNIFRAQVAQTQAHQIYQSALTTRSFGAQPGGLNPVRSGTWMQNQYKPRVFPQTSVARMNQPGAVFRTPVPFHPTPREYPRPKFTQLPRPVMSGRPQPTFPMNRTAGNPRRR